MAFIKKVWTPDEAAAAAIEACRSKDKFGYSNKRELKAIYRRHESKAIHYAVNSLARYQRWATARMITDN